MIQAEKLEALVRKAGLVEIEAADSLIVSYNQAGSVSVKVFATSGALRYSQQFSLFNHDFARALFGEKVKVPPGKERFAHQDYYKKNFPPGWQHHLQQAVISEDPIDYMYGAVFGE